MTLDELRAALDNWGAWARTGDPLSLQAGEDAPCAISPIFETWIPSQDWEPGWGDPAAPESIPDPIDVLAAERLSDVIGTLRARHWRALVRVYVKRDYRVLYEVIGAAERALLDRVANPQQDSQEKESSYGLCLADVLE